jgi:uncharacterized protein YyaL (SSP411 family)
MASNLINNVLEGVFKTFLLVEPDGMKMRHTTTVPFSHPYLEDFVFFAESQLRLYEISSNDVFKQNFKDAMNFVTKEFLTGDQMLTRAKLSDKADQYPNQDYNFFDGSFKSPVATYVQLMRRAAVLFADSSYVETIESLKANLTQTVLKVNPVSAGEALRALTYPNEVLRVMKIPKAWSQKEEFIKFIPFFLPRFVFDYHTDNDPSEPFEICTMNACEIKGAGFSEFTKILTPPEQEKL